MAIWFFHGKEDFKISKETDKLKKELLDEAFISMNYRVFYSPEFNELLDICSSAPLMFGNLLSVVHCENYFFKTKNKITEFSDEQLNSLDFALKNIADGNNIIFVCNVPRKKDKKIDSRTKLFRVIAQNSNIKDFPEYKDYDKELSACINEMIKEKGLIGDTKTIKLLIEQCGVNLRLIDSELEKLKITIFPDKKITEKDIIENCTLQEDILALADLVVSNDKNAVLKNFSATVEKKHPLEILSLLQTNLHKLIYIKTYEKEQSAMEMKEKIGMKGQSDYPVKLLQDKIRNKSLDELMVLKHTLTEAELKIKTGKIQNYEDFLENILLCGGQNVRKL